MPGVYLGARVSSRAPDAVIRPALILMLLGSALKLLSVQNAAVVLDDGHRRARRPAAVGARPTPRSVRRRRGTGRGYRRTSWVTAQAVAAPFGVGFAVALYYFATVRRRLDATRVGAVAPAMARLAEPASLGQGG